MKLYIINYTDEYQALCALEMKRLFDAPFKDVIVSNCDYDAGRSAFFKAKIDVLAHHHDLQTFLDLVSTVYVEKFKINYIKSKQDDLSYDLRMELVRSCASRMKGIGCIPVRLPIKIMICLFIHCTILPFHTDLIFPSKSNKRCNSKKGTWLPMPKFIRIMNTL